MKVIVSGTVGINKAAYLKRAAAIAREQGQNMSIAHVGEMMYDEAPDVVSGRILDLPLARLHLLRRSVFKDILARTEKEDNLIINTHAVFRWRHGLFPAFDFDQLAKFDADMYICLMDSVDCLHARLLNDHQIDHSLKDLLVWREEETLATEMMINGCRMVSRKNRDAKFYTLAVGKDHKTAHTFYQLLFERHKARAYFSFPMTHISDLPETQEEIDRLRGVLGRKYIIFDPADLEEQDIFVEALQASQMGAKVIEKTIMGQSFTFSVADILAVSGDIHAQIYARDFMLIEQADMIISYIPALPDGRPCLSSGVERELQHAHEATKEVYVIWIPQAAPSPFVTETATKIFYSVEEAIEALDIGE